MVDCKYFNLKVVKMKGFTDVSAKLLSLQSICLIMTDLLAYWVTFLVRSYVSES